MPCGARWAHVAGSLKYLHARAHAMAKEKRSAADLDAELAALEAELAALEGKPAKVAKKAKGAKPSAAPAPAAASGRAAEPTAEAAVEKKGRFALPKLGKTKADPAPEPDSEPASATAAPKPALARAPSPSSPLPSRSYDPSLWRQDGDAWVRVVPDTPVPVLRRVLDENGELVREEPASMRDVESARGVKAERGIGRLLRRS